MSWETLLTAQGNRRGSGGVSGTEVGVFFLSIPSGGGARPGCDGTWPSSGAWTCFWGTREPWQSLEQGRGIEHARCCSKTLARINPLDAHHSSTGGVAGTVHVLVPRQGNRAREGPLRSPK